MSVTNIVVECAKVRDKSEVILVEVSVTINRQHTPNLNKKKKHIESDASNLRLINHLFTPPSSHFLAIA